MAISLIAVNDQLNKVRGYISTHSARTYIRDHGTCANTNKLAGQGPGYYRCNGNCSWSASGSGR